MLPLWHTRNTFHLFIKGVIPKLIFALEFVGVCLIHCQFIFCSLEDLAFVHLCLRTPMTLHFEKLPVLFNFWVTLPFKVLTLPGYTDTRAPFPSDSKARCFLLVGVVVHDKRKPNTLYVVVCQRVQIFLIL